MADSNCLNDDTVQRRPAAGKSLLDAVRPTCQGRAERGPSIFPQLDGKKTLSSGSILAILLLAVMTLFAACSKGKHRNQGTATAAFNVLALLGKDIDQVRRIVGPTNHPGADEPDEETLKRWRIQRSVGIADDQDEWSNEFIRNETDVLLVTFNTQTRQVKELFLLGDDAAAQNTDTSASRKRLMQLWNLSNGATGYRLEFVKARNAPGITGVKIIPKTVN